MLCLNPAATHVGSASADRYGVDIGKQLSQIFKLINGQRRQLQVSEMTTAMLAPSLAGGPEVSDEQRIALGKLIQEWRDKSLSQDISPVGHGLSAVKQIFGQTELLGRGPFCTV